MNIFKNKHIGCEEVTIQPDNTKLDCFISLESEDTGSARVFTYRMSSYYDGNLVKGKTILRKNGEIYKVLSTTPSSDLLTQITILKKEI